MVIDVFVSHPESEVGVTECLLYIQAENVALLVDIPKRGDNFPSPDTTGQSGITPSG